MKKVIIVIGISMLLWSGSSQAATKYMRADGTAATALLSTGPATDAAACMSIATHNHVVNGAGALAAGDTIIVSDAGGAYTAMLSTKRTDLIYQGSGTPTWSNTDSPYDFNIAHANTTVREITFSGPANKTWVYVGADSAVLDALDITDSPHNTGYNSIKVQSTNCEIKNCTFTSAGTGTLLSDITGTGTLIHDNTFTAAYQCIGLAASAASTAQVYDNTFVGTDLALGGGSYGYGILIGANFGGSIYRNTIAGGANYAAVFAYTDEWVGIRSNNPFTGGVVKQNLAYYCTVGFAAYGTSSGTWTYNIAFLNTKNGFDNSAGDGNLFYNNISAFNHKHQFCQQTSGTNSRFANNIGWADGTLPAGLAGDRQCMSISSGNARLDNNFWILSNPAVGCYLGYIDSAERATMADYIAAVQATAGLTNLAGTAGAAEAHSIGEETLATALLYFLDVTIADRLDYDWHPSVTFPGRGKGVKLGLTADYAGTAISGTPNMGAYGFKSSGGTNPRTRSTRGGDRLR